MLYYAILYYTVDVPSDAANGEGVEPVCELPSEYSSALSTHVRRLASFQADMAALPVRLYVRTRVCFEQR